MTRIIRRDERVERINRKLGYYLEQGINQKKLKADEKHIIEDSKFQKAVENARKEFGLAEDEFLEDVTDLDDWLISKLAKNEFSQLSEDERNKLRYQAVGITERALDKANLPIGWFDYINAFIALGFPPDALVEPESANLIRVEQIEEDGEGLIIELRKGLKPEDYKKAWKAFKDFLNEPSRYRPKEDVLKNKIYMDSQRGWTAGKLAQKYFPREYERDRIAARDKVKKIIARFKIT